MSNRVSRWEMVAADDVAQKQFYAGVFGWTVKGNHVVCGGGLDGYISEADEDLPPMLTVYVEVDDLEGALERIGALGGRTLVPPMPSPVPTERGFAAFADPEGSMVGLATSGAAARAPKGAGAPVEWFELQVGDVAASRDFYEKAFDWTTSGDDPAVVVPAGAAGPIGAIVPRRGSAGQHAIVFATVEDLGAVLDAAVAAGGVAEQGPTPGADQRGSYALFRDPEGFLTGIWSR